MEELLEMMGFGKRLEIRLPLQLWGGSVGLCTAPHLDSRKLDSSDCCTVYR